MELAPIFFTCNQSIHSNPFEAIIIIHTISNMLESIWFLLSSYLILLDFTDCLLDASGKVGGANYPTPPFCWPSRDRLTCQVNVYSYIEQQCKKYILTQFLIFYVHPNDSSLMNIQLTNFIIHPLYSCSSSWPPPPLWSPSASASPSSSPPLLSSSSSSWILMLPLGKTSHMGLREVDNWRSSGGSLKHNHWNHHKNWTDYHRALSVWSRIIIIGTNMIIFQQPVQHKNLQVIIKYLSVLANPLLEDEFFTYSTGRLGSHSPGTDSSKMHWWWTPNMEKYQLWWCWWWRWLTWLTDMRMLRSSQKKKQKAYLHKEIRLS